MGSTSFKIRTKEERMTEELKKTYDDYITTLHVSNSLYICH